MKQHQLGNYIVFDSEHLTKKIIYSGDQVLVFVLNFIQGQKLPRHGHEGGTLTLLVNEGSGTIAIDEEQSIYKAGDLFILEGDETLELPSITSKTTLLVTISPNPSNPIYRQPR